MEKKKMDLICIDTDTKDMGNLGDTLRACLLFSETLLFLKKCGLRGVSEISLISRYTVFRVDSVLSEALI